jgi:hypothetical protein
MAAKFWASDGVAFRLADVLWVYASGAWRRVTKAWAYDGGWHQVYQGPTLSSILVIRDACTTTSGHVIDWFTLGTLTGWTITIEQKIGGGSYAVVASGVDPASGPYGTPYVSGDSEADYDFRVSLVRGSRAALNSPVEKLRPISLC